MEMTMTSWSTEPFGALGMPTPRPITRVLAPAALGFQGAAVSVAKTVLIDPADDRFVATGPGAGHVATQRVRTPSVDVSHPRLAGPPV